MAEWTRVVNTTITEHSREVEDNTMRDHKFLAKLKAKGRITYGHSGKDMDWRVKMAQASLSGLDDADTLSFQRVTRYKVATLPWRGYSMQDAMTEKEYLMNSGTPAIIKYYAEMGQNLLDDAQEQIHDEFFIDGNGTGNSKRFHGIESFLASAGGEAAGTLYATPSDTFAGLTTGPGDYGGSWTGTWPVGTSRTPEYDYWSPKLLNWSSTAWGTSSAAFDDNCNIVLRRAATHTNASKGKKGQVDTVLMDRNLFAQFKDKQETKEQLQVMRGESSDGLVALGFRDVINFDGMDVSQEFAIPANTVYGLNFNCVELRMLGEGAKQLFRVKGPTYDIQSLSWLLAIICFGNMTWNPRGFFKCFNYA